MLPSSGTKLSSQVEAYSRKLVGDLGFLLPTSTGSLSFGFAPTDPADFWNYQNEPVSLRFSHELGQEGAFRKDLM